MRHSRSAALPREAAPTTSRPPSTSHGRLIGLDLARGLAIVGMFAAHVGPDPSVGGPLGWLMEVFRGRSSALFAVLAGFSLVLLTGRPEPKTGRPGRQARGRVLIRSVILIALGYALTALDTSVDVILSFYGLLFVLALPLHRLQAGTLAAIAAVSAVVLPQILYLLRVLVSDGVWADGVIAHDPLARITGTDGISELLITGEYPVLSWFSFVVAGMAVAKLDLTRAGAATKLAMTGGVLSAAGYGGSWLALHLVPGAQSAVSSSTDGGSAASAWWSDTIGDPTRLNPHWLLIAAPHSQTTWSILGNTGIALLVLATCFIAMDRCTPVKWAATPVIALGSLALTAYVGHIIAIKALGMDDLPDAAAPSALLAFTTAALLLALTWTRYFRRGPLEYVLHAATAPARLLN
ncbi:DUF418 domain-containing protein [Streptomyces sp. NPDC053728]|uniref:DUF418 domain-containing protein n=1 Tax=Streptomyces sp. NPDC053728 TaxID=3155534 RepID=UPI003437F02B